VRLNPAPIFQNVQTLPTPLVQDVIFFETVDCVRELVPEYGTFHYNTEKYPSHKLGYAEPQDPQGLIWKFWYVANRESQELYDAELTLPYFNNPNYPRFQRTLILPRGDGPGESFEKIPVGTPDIQYPNARLVSKAVYNIEPPLNSLYQKCVLIFDEIPGGPGDTSFPPGNDQITNGYTWSRPIQTKDWIRLRWVLTLPNDVAIDNISDDYTDCPIIGFENLKLVDEITQDREDNPSALTIIRIYEGNLVGPPTSPSPEVKKRERQIPGALPPDKFCSTVTVTDDVRLVLDPNNEDIATVVAPTGTLVKVDVSPNGGKLRGEKDVQYGSFSTSSLSGLQWDNNLLTYTSYTITVMTPVQALEAVANNLAGTDISVQPLNVYWSLVTQETPIPSAIGSSAVKYYTSQPWTWPRVLTNLQFGEIGLVNPPDGSVLYVDYELKPEWQGLCKCMTEVAYYATNPLSAATDLPVQTLIPTSLAIDWPGVARFSIPSCLHADFSFTGSTGTNNPVYDYTVYTKAWEASQLWEGGTSTDQAVWPASLVVDYDCVPYKNGFKVRQITVYPPDV